MRLSLRLVFALIPAIGMAVIFTATFTPSAVLLQSVTVEFKQKLLDRTVDRISQGVGAMLDSVLTVLQINAEKFSCGAVRIPSAASSLSGMTSNSTVYSIYRGFLKDLQVTNSTFAYYTFMEPTKNDSAYFIGASYAVTGPDDTEYLFGGDYASAFVPVSRDGDVTGSATVYSYGDQKDEPAFKALNGATRGTVYISAPWIVPPFLTVIVTFAAALTSPETGAFRGIAGLEHNLQYLSEILADSRALETDEFLLVSQVDGQLIASSQGDLNFKHKGGFWNKTKEPEVDPSQWDPVLCAEHDKPWIRLTCQRLDKLIADGKSHSGNVRHRFEIDLSKVGATGLRGSEKKINVVAAPITRHNLKWWVVGVLSQEEYLKSIALRRNALIGAAVAFLVLCIGFTLLAGWLVTSPLRKLVAVLHKVSDMELESLGSKRSRLTEVALLQEEAERMVTKLNEYRSYLPEAVLAKQEPDNESESGRGSLTPNTSRANVREGSDRSSIPAASSHNSKVNVSITQNTMQTGQVTLLRVGIPPHRRNSDLYQIIFEEVRKQRGVTIALHADYVEAVWNASIRVGSHERSAAVAALNILRRWGAANSNAPDNRKESSVTVGAATAPAAIHLLLLSGPAQYGTVGCQESRSFQVVGETRRLLHQIAPLLPILRVRCISSGSIISAMGEGLQSRPVDIVSRPGTGDTKQPIILYEIQGLSDLGRDEWMYVLEANERKDPHQLYRKAFDNMLDNLSDAKRLFIEYLSNTPGDRHASRLLAACNSVAARSPARSYARRLHKLPFETFNDEVDPEEHVFAEDL